MNMTPANSEADIWLRTMLPDEEEILREKAEAILKLRLSAGDLARAEELGQKANAGDLTEAEADELHHYLTVGRALELMQAKSVSENCAESCGEGFWLWPRRRGPSIPNAGCKDRANAGHGQKTRRPEGFRAKGRLASLLLSRRSREDILLRLASPSGLWRENRTPRNFRTRSKARLALKRTNRRP